MPFPAAPAAYRFLCVWALGLLVLGLPASAMAVGEHDGHTAVPIPPLPSDQRFMAGTTGPIVPRGMAATVIIPDGHGFSNEDGRTQNNEDRAQNNYSVTDANFTNELGLLPRNPDTGEALTYVQHIQTYAAAGFVQTFAPGVYDTLVNRQNAGQGSVLGASAYLLGLVEAVDLAAQGIARAQIPATLPGSPLRADWYIRQGRDATDQDWARMHHAQTAPGVYKMLVDQGLPWNTALVLSGDDSISGSGRLNGLNNQNGNTGFNDDEKAVWSIAAAYQQATGKPVIYTMMLGHSHNHLDATALTKPKINAIIGLDPADRSLSEPRVAAIFAALIDGRVGSAELAANNRYILKNPAMLTADTDIQVNLDWPQYDRKNGETVTLTGKLRNSGPHLSRNVIMTVAPSAGVQILSVRVTGGHCGGAMCHVPLMTRDSELDAVVQVKLTGSLEAKLVVTANGDTGDRDKTNNTAERKYAVWAASKLSAKLVTAKGRTLTCGTKPTKPCVMRFGGESHVSGALAFGVANGTQRWMYVRYEKKSGKKWVKKADMWIQVDKKGNFKRTASRWDYKERGLFRVQAVADKVWLASDTKSPYRYLSIR